RVVHREVDRVDAETVDAAVEPEARRIQQGILNARVVHIEIGLLAQEIVQIILPAARIPGPGRAAKDRLPIVGRRTIRFGVGPDVPITALATATAAALLKPWMLVGTVRIDLIDDQLQ